MCHFIDDFRISAFTISVNFIFPAFGEIFKRLYCEYPMQSRSVTAVKILPKKVPKIFLLKVFACHCMLQYNFATHIIDN